MKIARILFPLPLPEPFDYAVPEGLHVEAGSYVRAPLGKIERTGVVWEMRDRAEDDTRELKPVLDVFPVPPMTEAMRRFIGFAARYNVAAPGHVLAMVLRARGGLKPSPVQTLYVATGHRSNRMTDARVKVLDAARETGPTSAAELARTAGVSPGGPPTSET